MARSHLEPRNTRWVPNDLDVLSLAEWRQVGLEDVRALTGGHQSRVFSGQLGDRRVVAKLTNAEYVDERQFTARINMLETLAQLDSSVVAPRRVRGHLLQQQAGWLIAVFPFAEGEPPDINQPADVSLMGRTLANLHRALASVPPTDIGQVAALKVTTRSPPGSPPQLLHGDFSTSNLPHHDGALRVFDVDDCGYGPVEFDVANTLYMELFDAVRNNRRARYTAFRASFVDAYASESRRNIDDNALDELIEVRRDALSYWIDHLDHAPIGIRTSPPEWLEQLRSLVDQI